ncbi:hypothetical protein NEOC65_000431 [Neochlamydia sp. AcF65]|nr:hypothetical protein [Neochlamydia sp. AcF65]
MKAKHAALLSLLHFMNIWDGIKRLPRLEARRLRMDSEGKKE